MTSRLQSALALIAGALCAAVTPRASIAPSAWAAENIVIPDGEFKGQLFDLELTPYLREPLDALGPDAPDNEVAVRKSAQSAFTTMALAMVGHSIDRDPCDMMIVQPVDSALADFNSQKLGRAIEASPVLKDRVRAQTNRSGKASTTYEKKFGGNSLFLCIATSASDISSKTIKKAVLDEVDRYPDDLDGQGSPIKLVAGRQTMFLGSGTWKRLYISTPTVKGASAIDDLFQAGDQRYWHVVCPGCSEKIVFSFDRDNFKFNATYPYKAHYVPSCCGVPIEGWQKNDLVRNAEAAGGGWIASAPGPGKYKSYHFDALSSPFVPWDEIAKEFLAAGDDPEKLKPFYNLMLGLPFEVRGDAPDHAALFARREDYRMGHIPPGALLVTCFADVQMRGIYVEVLAHAPDQQSWVIYADYLDGATTQCDQGAFTALTELYRREWPDGFGNRRRIDEFGVDSGYHTDAVYEWTRRHPGTKALKGEDGWNRVPLSPARDVDVNYAGRTIKGGAKLRLVGTWPLKSKFYIYVALQAIEQGSAIIHPPGYCHFGQFLDESYFKQITSEFLEEVNYRGRPRKQWSRVAGRENHWLDCRVGNIALANAYFASFTADDWAARAKERGIPDDLRAPDLFAPKEFAAVTLKPVEGATQAPAAAAHDAFAGLSDINKGVW